MIRKHDRMYRILEATCSLRVLRLPLLTELVLPRRIRTIWRTDVTHIPGASCIRLVDHASLHVSSRFSSYKLVAVDRPMRLVLKNEQNSKLNRFNQNARHSGQGRWSTFSYQAIAHSLASSQLSSPITTPWPPMASRRAERPTSVIPELLDTSSLMMLSLMAKAGAR